MLNGIIARGRAYVERERLQPDLNRAMRCTVGFMGPLLAAQWWHLPVEASFAALAAQNICLVDVRGSYPLRLSLLLFMTAVLAGSTWLGGATSVYLPLTLAAVLLLMLAGGVWRHLSAEYGPSLAIASSLLFLIALAHPDAAALANRHFLAALAGGLWGVAVQVSLWPFRAQHPLRRAVADSWVALSDLVAAMDPASHPDDGTREKLLTERQALLRTALDHASALLAGVAAGGTRPYVRRLEELNLAAARIATRFLALNTSLEILMARPDFNAALAPSFAPVLLGLTNTTRTIALTTVSRQPSHLASCEVRLRRLAHLLRALQDRVLSQTGRAPEGAQLTFILQQIAGQLPPVEQALRATIERANEHAAFPLELFDLQTWTLRPLASALNLQWRPDSALLRFVARATVLQLAGVALFRCLDIDRGYWLPLTTMVVLQPDYGATRTRAGQRVAGTLAGGLLASLLLWLQLPADVLLVALAGTMFGFGFWLKRNYGIAVFFVTLFVVIVTEISSRITVAFTLERLAATAAGGLLALLVAQLFWPVWEHARFPGLMARALRANRDLLRIVGDRLAAGGSYDAAVVAAKRAAEVASHLVFASLQRMAADPKEKQAGLEQAAALANGNQRLTRALTVVALHLTAGPGVARVDLAGFVTAAGDTLDAIATTAETATPNPAQFAALRAALDQLVFADPGPASPLEHSAATQFARAGTELSAMLLAAQAAQDESQPPFAATGTMAGSSAPG